ncbi:MAG: hypothetical protein PUD03_04055 [Lachnospiraceae bacterium]|nr:hypothetical protein [Lachnospiraceae bacterium]
MGSISVETKRIDELANAEAVGSENDLLLIRQADGTGTKNITVEAFRKAMTGDLSGLDTEEKDSIVAAINEILGIDKENAKEIEDLKNLCNVFNYDNAGLHNALYRGKYLGDSFTDEQSAAIRSGKFTDLWVGDYWTIGGVNYRIADFDYFLRSGDTECTQHHAVIVPDTALYNAQMNTSNVTTGGYTGSAMYTANLAQAKNTIKAAFGASHILGHREYLCNAVANGRPSGGAWFDSDIELMSESMAYGGNFFEPTSDGSTVPAKYSIACKQLNLFRHRPDLISNRVTYWLRNVVSASAFANVNGDGNADSSGASSSRGVRPAFPIY